MDRLWFDSPADLAKFIIQPTNLWHMRKELKEDFRVFGALIMDAAWKIRNRVIHEGLSLSQEVLSKILFKLTCENWRVKEPSMKASKFKGNHKWVKPA